ncbi:uncharacterized protein [Dermacentor andersoni]|uniref:uncharacterized protein n=1 Tax=Dermacentor andersoni TaxID=34620 RepID=UPI003B3AB3AC
MYLDSVAAQSIINSAPLPYLPEFRDGMHTTAVVAPPVKSPTARQRSLEDRAFCMHLDRVAADYMKNTKLPRLFAAGYDRQKKVGAISARYSNDFLSTYARVLPCSGETNEQISEDEEEKEEGNEQMDQIAKTDNAQEEDEQNEEQACDGKEKV